MPAQFFSRLLHLPKDLLAGLPGAVSRVWWVPGLVVLCMVLVTTGCELEELRELEERLPSLSDFLPDNPPLTTSLADAQYEVPFLDRFDPEETASLTDLDTGPSGGLLIPTGVYEGNLQSYCMHAGTHAPGGGRGYLSAPLAGAQSSAIRSILQNSVDHPDISQSQVQTLLWAVIAQARFEDLSRDNQAAAARLLSPSQLAMLNRRALDLVPDSVRQRALDELPPAARQVWEAENRIREMLTTAEATYSDLERIAFLTGVVPEGEGSRDIPIGRWSFHPDGYFIRYRPRGYTTTNVQVFRPEPVTIERDSLGRIRAFADTHGNRLETEYDDSIQPLTIPGDPDIRGYAFRSLRFIRPHPDHPGGVEVEEMELSGWTFVGIPGGEGQLATSPLPPRGTLVASSAMLYAGDSGQTWDSVFVDIHDRYQDAVKMRGEIESFQESIERQRGPRSREDIENITDIGHYETGLDAALDPSDIKGRSRWIHRHLLDLVPNAYAYATCRLTGGCEEPSGDPSDPTDGEEGWPEFDPSDSLAVPGNTARQRLAVSLRSAD